MNIKTELWNGHEIRFVEKEPGEWWAVAADVAIALDYMHTPHMLRMVEDQDKDVLKVDTLGGKQKSSVISELGIYDAIWSSQKSEAKDFKRWIKKTIQTLREESGLEAFQVFRMLDKEHQKEAMQRLSNGLRSPVRIDYMKANTVADKAVSNLFGHAKMVKKGQMTLDMLVKRQAILDDTVNLMSVNESFGLGLSISRAVYAKYS